jgi:hypothetical protein
MASRLPPKSAYDVAVVLRDVDQEQVRKWFAQLTKSSSAAQQVMLATKIQKALAAHLEFEDEMSYTDFAAAARDRAQEDAAFYRDSTQRWIAKLQASDNCLHRSRMDLPCSS